jgi:hypothetical protein
LSALASRSALAYTTIFSSVFPSKGFGQLDWCESSASVLFISSFEDLSLG